MQTQNRLSSNPSTSGPSPIAILNVSPALRRYQQTTLLNDLWNRPDLGLRDRSIVTLAALIARTHTTALPFFLSQALDHGVTPAEISEIITHLAFYSGWGAAVAAVASTSAVFAERGIDASQLPVASPELLPLDQP